MWWIIIIIGSVFIAGYIKFNKSNASKLSDQQDLESQGIDVNKFINVWRYIGGHPEIDDTLQRPKLYPNRDSLDIFNTYIFSTEDHMHDKFLTKKCGAIPFSSIKSVDVEDSSSITQKVSLGKLVLIGPLALAFKNDVKKEGAYLIINWNDGMFDHSTMFKFSHTGSISEANGIRNKILHLIKENAK